MRRYFLIFKLFLKAKFIFKNPKKSKLVIFDDESISDLDNLIFNYDFFILKNRIENIDKIYFSFKIMKFFFKYYRGNIMTAYLISMLKVIDPKLVLTNIDNSFKFFDLAKVLDKEMNFVAIQSASRFDLAEYKHLYKKKKIKSDYTKRLYIPNYLCFGQNEIDYFKKYKIKVKNFFKVGSLRLANFFFYIKKRKIKLNRTKYDICLISEIGHGRNDIYGENNIEQGLADMIKFTIKFCRQHKKKFIFAWKRDKKVSPEAYKRELSFLKKYLSESELNYLKVNSLKRKNRSYTSYISMNQSKVVVGFWSTMLREHLATGGKILSCNLIDTNIFDFPIQGICTIRNCTYQEFEKRLLNIYFMSKKKYFSKIKKDKCYMIEYSKSNSTINIIKRKIDYFLTGKKLKKI